MKKFGFVLIALGYAITAGALGNSPQGSADGAFADWFAKVEGLAAEMHGVTNADVSLEEVSRSPKSSHAELMTALAAIDPELSKFEKEKKAIEAQLKYAQTEEASYDGRLAALIREGDTLIRSNSHVNARLLTEARNTLSYLYLRLVSNRSSLSNLEQASAWAKQGEHVYKAAEQAFSDFLIRRGESREGKPLQEPAEFTGTTLKEYIRGFDHSEIIQFLQSTVHSVKGKSVKAAIRGAMQEAASRGAR